MNYTITQVLERLQVDMAEDPASFENAGGIAKMIPGALYHLRSCGMDETPANVLVMSKMCSDIVRVETWSVFEALVFQGLLTMALCAMQAQEVIDAAIGEGK